MCRVKYLLKPHRIGKRGQIFSTDFTIAAVVFLATLVFSIIYSNDASNRILLQEKANELDLAAQTAASSLVYSKGFPANWETHTGISTVSSIGLASTRNELSLQKIKRIEALNQANYAQIKDILGLSKFDVKVTISRMQNNQLLHEFGIAVPVEKSTSSATRIAALNGEEVIVQVKVFSQ